MPEAEGGIGGVERRVAVAGDDRGHRAGQVERQVALRRRITEQHAEQRGFVDAVVADDRGRCAGEWPEHGRTLQVQVDHRGHRRADGQDPLQFLGRELERTTVEEIDHPTVTRRLPRRLEPQDGDVGRGEVGDHRGVVAEMVAGRALDVHLDTARQRKCR